MKQNDFSMILVVAFLALLISFFTASKLFGSPGGHHAKVPVVDKISSEFPSATDSNYKNVFNSDSYDPTQLIKIGDKDQNTKPFTTL